MRVTIVTADVTSDLRRRVLRPQWTADRPMPGDDLPGAVHFAAREGAEIVGAAVLFPAVAPGGMDDGRTWQLRGMATDPGRQGQGTGGQVLRVMIEYVEDAGGGLIWCHARATALDFYRRHGFVAQGELFVHAGTGLPHALMTRAVPSRT